MGSPERLNWRFRSRERFFRSTRYVLVWGHDVSANHHCATCMKGYAAHVVFDRPSEHNQMFRLMIETVCSQKSNVLRTTSLIRLYSSTFEVPFRVYADYLRPMQIISVFMQIISALMQIVSRRMQIIKIMCTWYLLEWFVAKSLSIQPLTLKRKPYADHPTSYADDLRAFCAARANFLCKSFKFNRLWHIFMKTCQ